MDAVYLQHALWLIRMEYLEMPGLRLTLTQARRLFDLTEEACQRALESLVAAGFLTETKDGAYLRRSATQSH